MIVQALNDQGVDTVFGYPGGAVLPIYDEVFQQNSIKPHPGAPRTGRSACRRRLCPRQPANPAWLLVTSGPGATNAVTGITDALMDSIPIVVLTGQVPTFMIGSDAFQEADTVGITRPCTKHNWLVKDTDKLSGRDPRGLSCCHLGPPRPGADRHSQGCAVRHRHLHAAETLRLALPAAGQGRPGRDHRTGRCAWKPPSGPSSIPAAG